MFIVFIVFIECIVFIVFIVFLCLLSVLGVCWIHKVSTKTANATLFSVLSVHCTGERVQCTVFSVQGRGCLRPSVD